MVVEQHIGRSVQTARIVRARRTVHPHGGRPTIALRRDDGASGRGAVHQAVAGPLADTPRRRSPPVAASRATGSMIAALPGLMRGIVGAHPVVARRGHRSGHVAPDAPIRARFLPPRRRSAPMSAAGAVGLVSPGIVPPGSAPGAVPAPAPVHDPSAAPERGAGVVAAPSVPAVDRAVIARRQLSGLSAVLVVLGVLLGAVGVPAAWIVHTVVDEDRFVAMFAGLSDDSDVRDLVRGSVESSVLRYLPVPLDAEAEASASVRSAGAAVLRGDEFDRLWRGMVRSAHADTLATLRGDPVAIARTDREGGIGIRTGPAVAAVRERLIADGVPGAGTIPPVDDAVVLVDRPALGAARAIWGPMTVIGSLFPLLAVVAAGIGVAIARHRWRTIAVVAFAFAVAVTVADAVCNAVRDHLVDLAPTRQVADAVGVVVGTASLALGRLVLVVALLAVVAGIVALVVMGIGARVRRRRDEARAAEEDARVVA